MSVSECRNQTLYAGFWPQMSEMCFYLLLTATPMETDKIETVKDKTVKGTPKDTSAAQEEPMDTTDSTSDQTSVPSFPQAQGYEPFGFMTPSDATTSSKESVTEKYAEKEREEKGKDGKSEEKKVDKVTVDDKVESVQSSQDSIEWDSDDDVVTDAELEMIDPDVTVEDKKKSHK